MIVETPNDNEDEYIGPTLHFCLPLQATQPTLPNVNQGVKTPPPYLGSSFAVAPSFVYPREPYAPYQSQYGQNVGKMVNLGLMYPQGYL